jgi:hypothetical protein
MRVTLNLNRDKANVLHVQRERFNLLQEAHFALIAQREHIKIQTEQLSALNANKESSNQ